MSLKKFYGALLLNEDRERITLGHAIMIELMKRCVAEMTKHNERIEFATFHFAETKEKLEQLENEKPKESKEELSWAQQWAKEHPELITPIEEVESPIPGVSIEYWMERQSSPIYERWATLATNPEKRIGVPQELIDEARIAWEKHAPEIAPHFPKWKD